MSRPGFVVSGLRKRPRKRTARSRTATNSHWSSFANNECRTALLSAQRGVKPINRRKEQHGGDKALRPSERRTGHAECMDATLAQLFKQRAPLLRRPDPAFESGTAHAPYIFEPEARSSRSASFDSLLDMSAPSRSASASERFESWSLRIFSSIVFFATRR